MAKNRMGKQTMTFTNAPKVVSSGSVAAQDEAQGPLGDCFDMTLQDDTMGQDSFEKAERTMFETAVRISLEKMKRSPDSLDCLLGGDLLNQIVTANFAARSLRTPFLGLYGACSTMSESLLVGSALVNAGYMDRVACVASSHFSSAERQYRYPLEMGVTTTPTAQRTVTGAGCIIVSSAREEQAVFRHIAVKMATVGRVVDLGITDAANMGAAMAPAAADTILAHMRDTGRSPEDYDLIITGDLGNFGTEMLYSLCADKALDLSGRHMDCGNLVYPPVEKYNCGGSGCGCSAITLAGYLLDKIENGDCKRMLFLATGALLSPSSSLQGDSIPGIAHGVVLEKEAEA